MKYHQNALTSLNQKHPKTNAFVLAAHTGSLEAVSRALVASGVPAAAINLVAVPMELGLHEDWAHFETVLRLFRFVNQTEGDAYLRAHYPVLYLRALH